MFGNPDEKKTPKLIQALLDAMAQHRAAVAVAAVAGGQVGEVTEADVLCAEAIAEAAVDFMPKAVKPTEDEKKRTKAVGRARSVAFALLDIAAKHTPSAVSVIGFNLISGSGAGPAVMEVLNGLAATHPDLDALLFVSDCGLGKRGTFVKGKTKGPKPGALAWRMVTGAACAAGILKHEQVTAFEKNLSTKPVVEAVAA